MLEGDAAAILGAAFGILSKSPFSCDLIIQRGNSHNQYSLKVSLHRSKRKLKPVIARHWLLMPDDGLWYVMSFTVVQWYPGLRRNMMCTFSGLHCARYQMFLGIERVFMKYNKTDFFLTTVVSTVVYNAKLSVVWISGFGCETSGSLWIKSPEMWEYQNWRLCHRTSLVQRCKQPTRCNNFFVY